MKVTKKDLKKLRERIENQIDDYPRDSFVVGYNSGVKRSLQLLDELIANLDSL